MMNDLLTLLENPVLLLLVMAAGAFVGIAVERFVEKEKRERKSAYWRGRKHSAGPKFAFVKSGGGAKSFDAADQLRVVMDAEFTRQPLLNRSEMRVYAHLVRQLAEARADWQVMCQVSLGEIIASKDKQAFAAINSKRVDFLIVDAGCAPIVAIEFQGAGHYQSSAAARDAVKKEALRRSGIGYGEIASGDKPSEMRALLQRYLDRPEEGHRAEQNESVRS